MCANPDKFQSIIVDRDGKQSLSISVQDNTIFSDPSIKVLGVTLDDKLKFDEHVSHMCLKASRQINALKRVSRYLDESCRILVFKSFISSNFNYCPVSWMFCGKTNLNKLEKLQERALRLVFRDTTSPHTRPCLNGEISFRFQCTEYGAWPLKSLSAFMVTIQPIWIIYLVSPFWNIISEIHSALNSQNFILLHTASDPFVTMVLNYGISCHIRLRIPKTWTFLRRTSQSGATAKNVSLLMYSNCIQHCCYLLRTCMDSICSLNIIAVIFAWHTILSPVFKYILLIYFQGLII